MDERLIGVHLQAMDRAGRRRSWAGNAWLELDGWGRPSAAMEVPRDFVRFLSTAHSVTIHLLARPGKQDKRPAPDAGG